MSLYWWLHGKLTRRSRAQNWAEGIRVTVDDTGAQWAVPPRIEIAESRRVRWDELSGVAEWADDGTAPDGLFVLRRKALDADFLPLEAEGARAFLDAARARGLVRPVEELTAEREANERALSSDVVVRVAQPEDYDRARAAYLDWGYDGGIAPTDVVYIAERGSELTGIVRRTREHGVTMLRGLRVAPAWHRRRIGSRLLRAFVADLGDEVCYCVPYTHLVTLYGETGFKITRAEDAPPFLLKRLADYKRGGMDVLLMRRP